MNDQRGNHGTYFSIDVSDGAITSIVYLRGEVDLFNAQDARRELERIAAEVGGEMLTLDLGGLRHLSTRGVAVFVTLSETLAAGGRRLVVRNASSAVIQTFEAAGVAAELGVHRDPTDGVTLDGGV